MDPTTKFIAFIAFSALSLSAGYWARRQYPRSELLSRPIHLHTLLWTWGPAALLGLWKMQPDSQLIAVMLALPFLMLLAAAAALLAARALRCSPDHTGVLILMAGLSNSGFTLGGYLCYIRLSPPQQALGLAIAYTASMQVFTTLIFYPIAQHYGPGGRPLPLLIRDSFLDLASTPLYAAIVGIALSLARVPVPPFVDRLHLLDILIFAGALGAYLGIGLRLRLGDSRKYLPLHAALAALKFAVIPLATAAWLWAMHLTGHPLAPLGRNVMTIEAFTAAAIGAVMTANIFHLDARLASCLWLWNTILFCILPLPALLYFF